MLRLKRFQPLRVGDLHPAKLGLPCIERRRRHAVLAAKLGNGNPGSMFLQYPDDLCFGKPSSFHLSSPFFKAGLQVHMEKLSGITAALLHLVEGVHGGRQASSGRRHGTVCDH